LSVLAVTFALKIFSLESFTENLQRRITAYQRSLKSHALLTKFKLETTFTLLAKMLEIVRLTSRKSHHLSPLKTNNAEMIRELSSFKFLAPLSKMSLLPEELKV
jgi:hypothetical protein